MGCDAVRECVPIGITRIRMRHDTVRALEWTPEGLRLLDQRRLPGHETYLTCADAQSVAEAIRAMVVRGAPAIGIAAAYGAALAVRRAQTSPGPDWRRRVEQDLRRLLASRPTAVNLRWAVTQVEGLLEARPEDPAGAVEAWAVNLHRRDLEDNRRMGDTGAGFFGGSGAVLTHCNTGSLATGGYGTALGVIRSAFAAGHVSHVYADETRPWLQGSRLTAWELARDGIPVSVLADGAAAALLRRGEVDWVVVGADRVAANGDVANKIGTYHLALAARAHGVPLMVVAPTSTVDLETATGEDIPIEQRDASEVLAAAGYPGPEAGIGAWNPVFDVTPAELVSVLVTERGALRRPDAAGLASLMAAAAPRATA